MRPTVLLFDIDGTLVSTGGCARQAIERAFARHFADRLDGERAARAFQFRFDGMTDRAIVRCALHAAGLQRDEAATEADIDAFLVTYIEVLEEEVAAAKDYRLHNGVRRAVGEALEREGFAVGLGTGNIREGARVKLSRVDLYEPFTFGGFGCDHEDRPTLIRRGAERGAEKLGLPLEACRVVIIGDTPKDIAAARAMGAESLAVGTGSFGPAQLLACGATSAFRDLSAPDALGALLGTGSS